MTAIAGHHGLTCDANLLYEDGWYVNGKLYCIEGARGTREAAK